jgi:hypothetical protein
MKGKGEELSSTGTVPETMEMTKAILRPAAAVDARPDLWMDPATRAGLPFWRCLHITYLSD